MAKELSRPTEIMNFRQGNSFGDALETFLPSVFAPVSLRQMPQTQVANIDVIDRDDAFVLKAEIPGIEKDKLDIQVHGNQVYISGVKEEDESGEDESYVYRERRYGEFSRTVQLPVDIDSDKVKATFENGVLKVTLPKTEAAKRRRISIS